MKVAINKCFGGFGVSQEVYKELGIKRNDYGYICNDDLGIKKDDHNAYRSDPKFIAVLEKVGKDRCSGNFAKVVIIEIPDGIEFEIDNYDGQESIHEKHRSW